MVESIINTFADIKRLDGKQATAIGLYQAIPLPQKGGADEDAEADHAILVLGDGTRVFLESLDSPRSKRSRKERGNCEGKQVRVSGICHEVMPSRGAGLVAPCMSEISSVEPHTEP